MISTVYTSYVITRKQNSSPERLHKGIRPTDSNEEFREADFCYMIDTVDGNGTHADVRVIGSEKDRKKIRKRKRRKAS